MRILVYTIIINIILLVSCKKEKINQNCVSNCITFSGSITTDQNSVTPVEQAQVTVVHKKSSGIFVSSRKIAYTKTNSAGQYTLRFKPKNNELTEGYFELSVAKEGYFSTYDGFFDVQNTDTMILHNFHLPSITPIKITINNFDSSDPQNYIVARPFYFNFHGGYTSQMCFKPDGSSTNPEAHATTTVYTCHTAGNQYSIIDVRKRKNGVNSSYRDSVFCPKGQLVSYELDF